MADQLEEFISKIKGDLVVMGSTSLSKANVPIGSVSIGLMRQLTRPLLIVKTNSRNAAIELGKDTLKCMVPVDHSSRPLLSYVCTHILNAVR